MVLDIFVDAIFKNLKFGKMIIFCKEYFVGIKKLAVFYKFDPDLKHN